LRKERQDAGLAHGSIGRRTAVVQRRWISGSCAKIVCWQLVTHSNTHVERDPIQMLTVILTGAALIREREHVISPLPVARVEGR
jgi:hypothetical protein